MEGWRDRWRDGGMEGWRDGGMEGWMEGWMEGRMDGKINLSTMLQPETGSSLSALLILLGKGLFLSYTCVALV